jgi:hypothetical protein
MYVCHCWDFNIAAKLIENMEVGALRIDFFPHTCSILTSSLEGGLRRVEKTNKSNI